MKKISLRMRMTLVASLCLTIACIIMAIMFFWLANTQVVQYIDMYITTSEADIMELDGSVTSEYQPLDAVGIEGVDELLDKTLLDGLREFYIVGICILMIDVAIGTVMAWIISGWSIAPVRDLDKQIKQIDEKNMTTRICDFSAGDELQNLAESFNSMLERLELAFLRERRFSAAAAHELKTPLTVMRASIDVLELSDHPTLKEYRQTINHLKKQLGRMTELVTDLLSFTKSYDKTNDAEVALAPAVKRAIADLKEIYPKIQIEVSRIDCCTIMAKASIVEKVFFNLLDNAAKYSNMNGTVTVELESDSEGITFCVRDNGMGISEAAAPYIFEPFYRGDPSRNQRISGAGLGLALVKAFTDIHGGTIKYFPNSPCGSVFTLTIPMKEDS